MVLVIFLAAGQVGAKTDANISENLPETDGIYDIPGHPELKLRVIVHHGKPVEKPAKPGSQAPILVCNLPDADSPSVVSSAGWYIPANWTYRLNPSSVPNQVGKSNLAAIASNAFAPWNSAISGKVNISQGANTSVAKASRDGINVITWGRTSGTALATTYIWYNTASSPHEVTELDTVMNLKYSWAWSDPSTWASQTNYQPGTTCAYQGVYDAQAIMTHEIGHWYGLDDEYDAVLYSDNTMFGYGYTGRSNADTLTIGDITGVQSIYPN